MSPPKESCRRPPLRRHLPRARAFLLVLATVGLWACSSDSTGPGASPGVPTTLTAMEGIGLQAPAGTVLPEGPTVRVLDQFGNPMEELSVTFQVLEGGGATPVPSRQTDSLGQARSAWILGRDAGDPQRLRASVGSLFVDFNAVAIQAVPGQSYLGRNGYVEYWPGEMPLVLSAPHGGELTPEEISDRSYGTTAQDRNTLELALRIREAIRARTGTYPHIVVSHLHRTKLDPNREIVEAAQGDPEAERAWWEFQAFLDEAGQLVQDRFEKGLYIDLHGHGHEIQRLELGYLLSSGDLANPDEVLSGAPFINKSSFRALGLEPGVDFAALIRGPSSLGSLFEAQGFPAVPSRNQPGPGDDPFFTGGYNSARHGSRDGGSVSGVQIECNYSGVRDTEENREAFAEALAEVLSAFLPAYLNGKASIIPAVSGSPPAPPTGHPSPPE